MSNSSSSIALNATELGMIANLSSKTVCLSSHAFLKMEQTRNAILKVPLIGKGLEQIYWIHANTGFSLTLFSIFGFKWLICFGGVILNLDLTFITYLTKYKFLSFFKIVWNFASKGHFEVHATSNWLWTALALRSWKQVLSSHSIWLPPVRTSWRCCPVDWSKHYLGSVLFSRTATALQSELIAFLVQLLQFGMIFSVR